MGILYVVATPIGNLDDISKRCLDVLSSVDLIACEDTRQTIKILNRFEIKKRMVSYHKFNEDKKSNEFVELLKSGKNIALVSDAGTPCISDPGYVLVKLAKENNIEVIGIPGPSALVTALSVSGVNTDAFSFVGFFPIDNKKQIELMDSIINSNINTFIIYESPKRLKKTIKKISECIPNCLVSISSDLTKIHERNFYGDISSVLEEINKDTNIEKGEYVIVIEKKSRAIEVEGEYSLEALIIDYVIKNNCSIKESINYISKNNNKIKKNDLYNASLNLKKFIQK